jgi:carbon-monoxide dehydrogenase small subunit
MRDDDLDLPLLRLTVNDQQHTVAAAARTTLADLLRHELRLTGTHVGCEHGVCGACTVLIDGLPVRSCLMLAVQAEGSSVRTVESLSRDGELNDLQASFARNHGLQCGFCTPGFLMLIEGFLTTTPEPDREQIRDVVASNMCRCTGYQTIVDAVAECVEERKRTASTRAEPGPARQDRSGAGTEY